MATKKVVVLPVEVSTLPITPFKPILTPKQAAKVLQVNRSTIYESTRKSNSGRKPLPHLRAGKFLRFRRSEIERWLNESRKAA
jgi:excisionase family DNA binding protein